MKNAAARWRRRNWSSSHEWRAEPTHVVVTSPQPISFPLNMQQPHSRFSALSGSSLSSADLLSPTNSSARFSLPPTPLINTTLGQSRPAAQRPNIYDRNLNKTRTAEVSASAFAFLFSEVVQYTQKRVSGINDLERR